MKVRLLIPAAGMGTRLGSAGPKALVDLCGEPMLARTLARFFFVSPAPPVIVTAPPGHVGEFEAALSGAASKLECMVTPGGLERQESVAGALALLDNDDDLVLIHDAARPFVSPESIRAGIAAAERHGAATVAVPAVDTVLMGDSDAFLVGTPDRSSLWCCQTPQIFRVGVIREAHRRAAEEGRRGTDDASLVREAGMPVKLVMGAALNFKITTPFDLDVARMVVREGLAC